MRSTTSPPTTCHQSRRSAQPAADRRLTTGASSKCCGSSWPPAAAGRTYRPRWAAPAGPPIAFSDSGRRWAAGTVHADLLRLLRQAGKLDPDLVIVDAVLVRAFGGGELTGPSPVDRGKKGSKHTLLVDRHGVPLAIRTAGANASDHRQIIPLVLDFPKVTGKPGRPKEMPDELYADRGFDSDDTRWILAWLGIEPHIAKRRTPHGSGLGKVRWVVERTISWVKGLRRMRVRYDRLGVIRDAFTTLAASVICFRILVHDTI
jgi:transposase